MAVEFAKLDHSKKLIASLCLAQLILGAIDLLTVPGTDIAQFHVMIILFSFFVGSRKFPYVLAMIASSLTTLDLILPPHDTYSPVLVIFLRRAFGIINFWAIAYVTNLLIHYKQNRDLLLASLEKEKAKVQQSNRELENFAAVAAHDLSSPLRSMVGWSELLEETEKDSLKDISLKALTFIKENAKRCTKLIEELLELARVNPHAEQRPVPLDEILSTVLDGIRNDIDAASAKVVISKLPTIHANPTHLTALFSNLIKNALVYRDESRPILIEVGCKEAVDSVEIFVKDNGIGIDEANKTAIFEMFKRLHSQSERPGTGIGLALCKKVVDSMNGKIWVESELGKGSRFIVELPSY